MKKLFIILVAMFLMLPAAVHADELDRMQGIWTTKKTGPDGESVKQVLEITKNKFSFKIISGSDETVFVADGVVEVKDLGPFKSVSFTKIRGARPGDEMKEMNDDRTMVYVLTSSTFSLAANFDKEREQPPTLDIYKKTVK